MTKKLNKANEQIESLNINRSLLPHFSHLLVFISGEWLNYIMQLQLNALLQQ